MRQFLLNLLGEAPAEAGDILDLGQDEAKHIKTVLRLDAGAVLNFTDGCGYRYTGRLVSGPGAPAAVQIVTCERDALEFQPPLIVLAVAVVKGKRFEWVLEKACELGAHVLIPLQTEFGVIDPRGGKQKRWRTIISTALKQSGRCLLPELKEPQTLTQVLGQARGPVWFGASPGAERERSRRIPRPREPLPGALETPARLTVCIGPEGGWSSGELDHLVDSGAVALDLGPHVLRTETAAVAALAVLRLMYKGEIPETGAS